MLERAYRPRAAPRAVAVVKVRARDDKGGVGGARAHARPYSDSRHRENVKAAGTRGMRAEPQKVPSVDDKLVRVDGETRVGIVLGQQRQDARPVLVQDSCGKEKRAI